MSVSSHLLEKSCNLCVVIPSWVTFGDWIEITAQHPHALPLFDFAQEGLWRVRSTRLNWFLMDFFGLREYWVSGHWHSSQEIWLLIHPMRYRLLGHQPKQPYAYDVMQHLKKTTPWLLSHTLAEHAYFAPIPTIDRHAYNDLQAELRAADAPWQRVTVLDAQNHIVGMVYSGGKHTGKLPPILNLPFSTVVTPSN